MDAYTAQSPFLGAGQATAAEIGDWFTHHTPAAPGAAIGQAVMTFGGAYGLNTDLIAAQIAHETGFWSSDWAVNHNNPAGIGVTGEPGKGETFPSVAAGIRAMVAHLLTYVEGASNPLASVDPRYQAAMGAGYGGSAKTLADLDGRWAVPGVGYGAAIASLANELVSFALSEGGNMPDLWYPAATRHPAACFTVGAQANPARVYPSGVDTVVMHHTDGSAAGTIQWFANPASQVSAHFLVARDGSVHQFVSLADVAWHAGDWPVNVRSVGIEHEQAQLLDASGKPTGQWQDWPQVQLQASADLLTWLKARLGGWTVKRHREVSDNPTSCPGDLPVEMILGLMGTPTPAPSAPAPPAADVRTLNGHTLAGGFRAYYEKIEAALGADEALMLLGLPLTDETQENGITVQYFERAVFEWHPGSRPADFDVLLRRLGADALAAKTSS